MGKKPEWDKICRKCDINGDGKISFEEFFTAASDRFKILEKENLRAAFNVLDQNGDNIIEAKEIKACFMKGTMSTFVNTEDDDAFFDKIIR